MDKSNKNFQKLLGDDVGRIANLQGDERERELVRCYSEAVRKAGNFPYVCTMPVLKSVNESFHFHMIYATRSPKGVEEFKKAEKDVVPLMHSVRADAQHRRKFESTQQYSLLEPGDTYQENRYSRYREANLGFAREAVNRKVQEATPTIAFDDVWAEWMQFACVQDEDLQDCIGKLARDGTITIENRPNRALKLTRGKNIRLKRI
jgi:hypothetical protein